MLRRQHLSSGVNFNPLDLSTAPPPKQALSCAVCVVGQLARLELESKVRHPLVLGLGLGLGVELG